MPTPFKIKEPGFPQRQKFTDGYPRKEQFNEITFDGPKIILPPHNPGGPYPGIYGYDRVGNFMWNLDGHELTNDGKTWHMHVTMKTARFMSNLDHSRWHVTIGHEVAQFQTTDKLEVVSQLPQINPVEKALTSLPADNSVTFRQYSDGRGIITVQLANGDKKYYKGANMLEAMKQWLT